MEALRCKRKAVDAVKQHPRRRGRRPPDLDLRENGQTPGLRIEPEESRFWTLEKWGMLPRDLRPSSSERSQARTFFRPIVEGRWIEVGAIGPNEGLRFGIQTDLIEDLGLR